ncbi:hypothetical protein JOQ06_023003 [Pogonophryne albipinna]|uniref:Ig-like domain-containing protein n=1 Tax=Pogonophryne albipinna TaxID=1090488 RepID=A0AAD6ABF1_9TELE|nr:hypothetical protein JOQ06_023003 [Pogonophryne albipinna]
MFLNYRRERNFHIHQSSTQTIIITFIQHAGSAVKISLHYREKSSVQKAALLLCPTDTPNKQLVVMSFTECKGQDTVTQTTGEVSATEGDTVTLGCTFKTSNTAYLFWYKQEVNGYPKYMLMRYVGTRVNAAEFQKDKFDATINETSVPLQISSAAVTDSAVYYCVLRPTVTGNTNTLYKNLWSKDNTILINIHQRESLSKVYDRPPCVSCEDLTPVKTEEFSSEGSTVTLSYKAGSNANYYFWYRQYPGEPPEFLISHSASGTVVTNPIPGLNITVESNRINLIISSAAVTDSAVYYCALRPTVTGNTNTLYKNLWSKDNTTLHNIHQREALSVRP